MRALQTFMCILLAAAPGTAQIVVDHTTTDVTQIPSEWIDAVRTDVAWVYLHTSHGAQLEEGASYLRDYVDAAAYDFVSLRDEVIPAQTTPSVLREVYHWWYWDDAEAFHAQAVAMLDAAHAASTYRVFLWSWCGDMSSTSTDVQGYLDKMVQLQGEYPDVLFVFMTGHTEEASDATVQANNDLVRTHVATNGGLLFDFADIERYLPDGTPYAGTPDDSCPWCQDWCDSHPGFCPSPAISCSHSHSLLCYLKGQAWWWLSARIAGWAGPDVIFSDDFELGTTEDWSSSSAG